MSKIERNNLKKSNFFGVVKQKTLRFCIKAEQNLLEPKKSTEFYVDMTKRPEIVELRGRVWLKLKKICFSRILPHGNDQFMWSHGWPVNAKSFKWNGKKLVMFSFQTPELAVEKIFYENNVKDESALLLIWLKKKVKVLDRKNNSLWGSRGVSRHCRNTCTYTETLWQEWRTS